MASADRSDAVVTIRSGTPRYEETHTDPPAAYPGLGQLLYGGRDQFRGLLA